MSPHWQGWFAMGVRTFGLSPGDFWRLSVLEWRALCASQGGAKPPDRQMLTALMAQHPDGDENDGYV